MTALPGEPRRPKADDQIACEPGGNDLRLKDRAPVARLAILGWRGADRFHRSLDDPPPRGNA